MDDKPKTVNQMRLNASQGSLQTDSPGLVEEYPIQINSQTLNDASEIRGQEPNFNQDSTFNLAPTDSIENQPTVGNNISTIVTGTSQSQMQENTTEISHDSTTINNQAAKVIMEQDNHVDVDEKPNKEKEYNRGIGCNPFWLFRLSCRKIACLGCLMPIILFALIVVAIIYKPEGIWDSLKTFTNNGLNNEGYFQVGEADATNFPSTLLNKSSVKNTIQSTEVDFVEVKLTEQNLATLIKDQFSTPEKVYVDINEERISVLFDADDRGEPLWFYTDITLNEDKIDLSESGFGRFELPSFLLLSIRDLVAQGLTFINIQESEEFMQRLLEQKYEAADVDDVEFREGEIILRLSE